MELQTTTSVIGVALAGLILYLVRRDHLYLRDAAFWIGVAGLSVLFGLWPRFIDQLSAIAGVAYSPTLFLLIGLLVLVTRALMSDLALTQLRRDIRRLNQRVALLDAELAGRALRGAEPDRDRLTDGCAAL